MRLGIQQTPWVDFEEGIYRYRFQGTIFAEREGFLSSSDAGASFHYNFRRNYGDVHVGVYNGENYNQAEANDQKAFQIRGTLRPLPQGRGASAACASPASTTHDAYVKNGRAAPRHLRGDLRAPVPQRGVRLPRHTTDQTPRDDAPKSTAQRLLVLGHAASRRTGWEGLFRYDHLEPNNDLDEPDANAHDRRRRLLVPAPGQRRRRRCCSTTSNVDNNGLHAAAADAAARSRVHALVNF